MVLDTLTLLILMVLQGSVAGVALLAVSRLYAGALRQSMSAWGTALLLVVAGWVLLALRGRIPDFLSIIVANTIFMWSIGVLYQAFRRYDDLPPRHGLFVLLTVLLLVVYVPFTYWKPDIFVRTVVSSFLVGIGLSATAWHLVAYRGAETTGLRRLNGLMYGGVALLYLIRGVALLLAGSVPQSVLSNEFLYAMVFLLTSVAMVLGTITYLLMCNERQNHELQRLVLTDPLTGLYNRRAGEDLTEREILRARRNGSALSLMMIDANGFKSINDTYGHRAGDMALVQIARILSRSVRGHDIVARLGGDEFSITLPDTTEANAEALATRLAAAIALKPLDYDGIRIPLRVSIGIAELDHEHPDYDVLKHTADMALYEVKRGSSPEISTVSVVRSNPVLRKAGPVH